MASTQIAHITNGISTNQIELETNVEYEILQTTIGYHAIGVYEYKVLYGSEIWTPFNTKTFTTIPDKYILGVKTTGTLTITITNGTGAVPNFGIPFRRTDTTVTKDNPGHYYGTTITSTYTAAQDTTPESNILSIPSSLGLPYKDAKSATGTIPVAIAFSGVSEEQYTIPDGWIRQARKENHRVSEEQYTIPDTITLYSSNDSTTADIIKVVNDSTDHTKDIYVIKGTLPGDATTATLDLVKKTTVTLADGLWQDYGTDFTSESKVVGSWLNIDSSIVTFTPRS